MEKKDKSAVHLLIDRIVTLAREGTGDRKQFDERIRNQRESLDRLQRENDSYYDALEAHRAALRKLGARGKKMPAAPAFHAERVKARRDDDIPF